MGHLLRTHPLPLKPMDNADVVAIIDRSLAGGMLGGEAHLARIRLRMTCKDYHRHLPRLRLVSRERMIITKKLLSHVHSHWDETNLHVRLSPVRSSKYYHIISQHEPFTLCRHYLLLSPRRSCPACEITDGPWLQRVERDATEFLFCPGYYALMAVVSFDMGCKGLSTTDNSRWYQLGMAALFSGIACAEWVRDTRRARQRREDAFTLLRFVSRL
jgi:hypothetical protein